MTQVLGVLHAQDVAFQITGSSGAGGTSRATTADSLNTSLALAQCARTPARMSLVGPCFLLLLTTRPSKNVTS